MGCSGELLEKGHGSLRKLLREKQFVINICL